MKKEIVPTRKSHDGAALSFGGRNSHYGDLRQNGRDVVCLGTG